MIVPRIVHWLKASYTACEKLCANHPIAVVAAVVAACAVVALIRRPDILWQAQFWAEDGKIWYADAYNHGFSVLFEPYGGYLVVIYRLVAMLSLLLPLHLAPAFFNVIGLAFQLVPIILLCSPRLKAIIPSRVFGVALSLLYISLPNTAEVFANLTNIQWHLGLAAFLVLIASPAKSRAWRLFDYMVLIATGLSGPLVIVLLPIIGWLWWKKRSSYHRRRFVIVGVLACIQMMSIFFLSHADRLAAGTKGSLLYLIQMITGQIFTGGLLGQANVTLTYGHLQFLLPVFVIGMVMVIYVFIKGPQWLRLLQGYAVLIIAAMLASLKPVPDFDPWQGLTNPGGGQRYWYIPIMVWIGTLLWLAFNAQIFMRTIAIIGTASLLLVGVPTDWHILPRPYHDFRAFAMQFKNKQPGTAMDIPINPGWVMTLTKK